MKPDPIAIWFWYCPECDLTYTKTDARDITCPRCHTSIVRLQGTKRKSEFGPEKRNAVVIRF